VVCREVRVRGWEADQKTNGKDLVQVVQIDICSPEKPFPYILAHNYSGVPLALLLKSLLKPQTAAMVENVSQ
jgi:hypothetical protein